MENKYWHILLKSWRENKRNGLTIPFIIGSQNYLPKNLKRQNIKELMMDIASSKYEIYITYCMDIDDLILGIRDESKLNIAGDFLQLNNLKSNLFQTKFVNNLGNNVETLVDSLTTKYKKEIDNSKYSINNNEREFFNECDIKFIKECFKIYYYKCE